MTETPTTNQTKSISVFKTTGSKNNVGQNSKEAKAILSDVLKLIKSENNLNKLYVSSIGILSPFTSQVTLLKKLVRDTIQTSQLKKHNVLIGTPYQFQGEERDKMFISFCIDNHIHHSTYNYLNKVDVFKVSITRARTLQYIYTSLSLDKLGNKHLIHRYLKHVTEIPEPAGTTYVLHDMFAAEVIEHIKQWGVDKIYTSHSIAGVEIDIVVTQDKSTYCIDLIGYPGDFVRQFTPQKLRMLDRMKHHVFFIPYSSWHLEREKCLKNLKKYLDLEA